MTMATIWVASENADVRPTTSAGVGGQLLFRAGRNEFCSAQICVRGPATGVSVSVAPFGPIGVGDVHLFRASIINLVHPSGPDGWTGPTFDGLIPDVDDVVGEKRNAFPFDVPAGETRVVWLDLHVPAGSAPGEYRGAATVRVAAQPDVTLPIVLSVLRYTIPSTASLRSFYGLGYGSLERQHQGADIPALRARYGALGLDHRISLGGHDDGNADPAHAAAVYGPLLAGTAPTQLVGARLTSWQLMFDRAAMWAMLKSNGWQDRGFDYTADEPGTGGTGTPWAEVGPRLAAVHAIDPAIPTLVTMTINNATAHGLDGQVSILCPIINELNAKTGAYAGGQGGSYDAWRKADFARQLWTYDACDSHGCNWVDPDAKGWPTASIDAPPMQHRAMPWLGFVFQLNGTLYYEVCQSYDKDPWTDSYRFGGNGDGTFFLPGTPARIGGKTDIPCATIRLKRRRAGDQDAELLRLADQLGLSVGWAAVSALWPTPYQPPSVTLFESTRAMLADAVDKATAPAPPPAPVLDLSGVRADLEVATEALGAALRKLGP
jgi:hypothetical protein